MDENGKKAWVWSDSTCKSSGEGFECAGPYEAAHAAELPSKAQAGPRNPTKVFKNVISLCTQWCKRIDSVPLHLLQPVHFQATKTEH